MDGPRARGSTRAIGTLAGGVGRMVGISAFDLI